VATSARSQLWTQAGLLVTGVLGFAFLGFEARDFANMLAQGAGPERSAFLSSLFSVVGLHGAHVTAGLLWLGTMMAQVFVKGFRPAIMRRLLCFYLFWHVLDIIWVALFTVVYLIGELCDRAGTCRSAHCSFVRSGLHGSHLEAGHSGGTRCAGGRADWCASRILSSSDDRAG
jgi:hypothetical protein